MVRFANLIVKKERTASTTSAISCTPKPPIPVIRQPDLGLGERRFRRGDVELDATEILQVARSEIGIGVVGVLDERSSGVVRNIREGHVDAFWDLRQGE